MNLQTPDTIANAQVLGLHQPALAEGEVHIWSTEYAAMHELEWTALLSDAENRQALRFQQEKDRRRYVIRHGLLRLLLGRYLGCDGGDVDITTGPSGKPELWLDGNQADLRFNLSSSRGLCLFAFTRGCNIGVDVEAVDASTDVQALVERLLTPMEAIWWRSRAPSQRIAAFYELWTRKETLVKCSSVGVGVDLTGIETGIGQPLIDDRGPRGATRFSVTGLHAWPGYAAALAVQGPTPHIMRWYRVRAPEVQSKPAITQRIEGESELIFG